MKHLLLVACWFLSLSTVVAQPAKRLYIANDDHTDYMWTANEATYDSAFVQMLDYYLRQIDSTRTNPPDFQARFNCDGSYWLRAYQKYRSPAQFERLLGAIRSGHISSPLNALVSCYGAQPTEAVLRGMYYAGSLERAHNLRFTLVGAMENNTLPLGLASLWAGAGAKYSWKGIGGYGSQMTYEYRANRRHQLYRYTGLDGAGILTKWYEYPDANSAFGGYAECRFYPKKRPVSQTTEIEQVIDKLTAYCNTPRYPFAVAGAFGYGWDDLSTFVSAPFIEAARNGTNATRTVRVSNEEDFFRDVARTYPRLPAESVSYGNEWDLYCASMNETTAKVRRSTEKLRTAETLASLVSLRDARFADELNAPANRTARNLAWESFGMYWEHNWTADGPVKQPVRATWQTKIQQQISGYTDTLFTRSVRALGGQLKKITSSSAGTTRFFVFNPLNWIRSDLADMAYAGTGPVRVVDVTTNREVASQALTKAGKPFIRIRAENLPPVGYRVYEIRRGEPKTRPLAATVKGEFISNARYRLRLSPSGAITELYDSLAGSRQLVKAQDGRYLNDLGATDMNEGSPVVVENAGPVSVTLKAVSSKPVLHTIRVTLFANSPRIEIEDSIQANFNDIKTWVFSFNLNNPTTHHEETGAILTAKKETRGGHYAAQNARLDWQTFNHFADLSEANYGITLSNVDCSFFKLGPSTATADRVDSLWEQSSQLSALAGGQVDTKREDKGVLGIRGQNGETRFGYHFALTTHPTGFDAVAAMRFALEHQNPLVTGLVTGSRNTYPGTTFSLLRTAAANRSEHRTTADGVLLWSLKPGEEGSRSGLIARFWNVTGKAVAPRLTVAQPIRRAWQTTHIETNERTLPTANGQLKLNFRPNQMNTYRLQF